MSSEVPSPGHRTSGLAADVDDLYRIALRDQWGLALIWVGWVHLGLFLVCQWLYGLGDRAETHFLSLWGIDVGLGVMILRRTLVERRVGPMPSLFVLVARIWITFLILDFSSAGLNSLVGFETDWFKAVWATLSTFGFATMAWIFHLKFLVPACQMSLTAVMIARFPEFAYAIYGISWCLALNVVGYALEKRRRLFWVGGLDGKVRLPFEPQVADLN